MLKITTLFLLLLPITCFSQVTQDSIYEKEIKLIISFLKKQNVDSTKIVAQRIFNNYDVDCIQKGRIYQKVGTCLYYVGQDEEAVRYLRDSTLLAWQECDNIDVFHYFSATRILIGLLNQNKRLDEAKEWIRFIESDPKHLEGQRLSNVFKYYILAAKVYSNSEDYFAANRYFEKAYIKLHENKRWIHKYSFDYYNEYAMHLNEYGQYDKSIEYYNQVKEHFYQDYDDFIYYCNVLSPLIASNRLEEANIIADSLKKVLLSTDDLGYSSFALKQIAKLEIAKQNFTEAKIIIEKLDSIYENNSFNIADIAYNEDLKATLAYNEGDYSLSKSYTNNAINKLVNNNNLDVSGDEFNYDNSTIINAESLKHILKNAFELSQKQYIQKQKPEDIKTLLNIATGISSLYIKNRKSYASEVSGLSQLSKTYNFYDRVMDVVSDYYFKTNDKSVLNKLIWLSLNNKNDVLTNLLNTKNVYQRNLDKKTFTKLTELENSKRKIELEISKNKSLNIKESADSLTQVFLEAKQNLQQFKSSAEANNSKLKQELKLSENSFKKFDIQQTLNASTALVDIFYGEKNIYISTVTKNNINLDKVKITLDLSQKINKLIKNLQNYGNIKEFKESSLEVNQLILKNTLDLLEKENVKNICVLNDGLLHDIPFESYWTGDSYLVEKFNFIYLTNIAKLNSDKLEKLNSNLGFATSYSNDLNKNINSALNRTDISLSALSNSNSEIDVTHKAFPGTIYKDKEATISTFRKSLKNKNDILHLALHGLVIDENNAAIIFDDHSNDFVLSSEEVYKLDIRNKLTILSACYSGKGKIYSGEGIRNLARAFLYAGSKNVIPSMWSASDVSSQEIISNFVEQLKESGDISNSLTEAKRNYLSKSSPAYSHPSYWSNVIFIGSPQISGGFNSTYVLGIVLLGIILCLILFLKRGNK